MWIVLEDPKTTLLPVLEISLSDLFKLKIWGYVVQKYTDRHIQNFDFAYCFVWV